MDVEPNSTGGLADHGTAFEGVVDTLDRVVFHTHKEARAKLRVGCACIEKGGRGVGKVALGHEGVCLNELFNVRAMDADGDTHDEVLRPLGDATINA